MPGHTGRDWRCGRPGRGWPCIGPSTAMHNAPWTKTSRPSRVWPRMRPISSSDSSRASTTRSQAKRLGHADALGAGERHLRRGVHGPIGAEGVNQPRGPQVLHQHGIDPGGDGLSGGKLQCRQLVVEDERVERDVALHAAAVQVAHQRGEFVGGEVDGPGAGVQAAAEAEIDGIGAVFHGGRAQAASPAGASSSGRGGVFSSVVIPIHYTGDRPLRPLGQWVLPWWFLPLREDAVFGRALVGGRSL